MPQKKNCCLNLNSFFWAFLLLGVLVPQVLAVWAASSSKLCVPAPMNGLQLCCLLLLLAVTPKPFRSLSLCQESTTAHRREAIRRKLGSTQWAFPSLQDLIAHVWWLSSNLMPSNRRLCFNILSVFLVVLCGSPHLLQATSSQQQVEVINFLTFIKVQYVRIYLFI